jgi:translocation and assembly module TamB
MPQGLRLFAIGLLAALALLASLPFALDTAPGRAWLVRQLPVLELESGLNFAVAGIDGSLWGKARLRGVELRDPKGRFARIDRLDVDWQPLALFSNRFAARSLVAGTISIDRLPALRPSSDPRLLPSLDISIDRLDAPRIILAAGVAGARARQASLNGRIDIAAGRALVQVNAAATGSTDRLVLDLDAEPDRDRFALTARLDAPAGGLVAGLTGMTADLMADARGRGRWQAWNGRVQARSGAAVLADAALTLNQGEFGLAGRIDPAGLLANPQLKALLNGGLAINLRARPRDRAVQVTATATGRWLNGRIAGRIDREAERIEDGDLALRLADGAPLPAGIALKGLGITARLSGPWLAPQAQTKASAAALILPSGITLEQVSASAIIDANDGSAAVPAAVGVASVRGLPADLAPLAGRWQASGALTWRNGQLRGDGLLLKSGPLAARLGINWVPATGAWGARIAARVVGWALPQLGSSDADINLDLRPGPVSGLVGSGDFKLAAAHPPAGGLSRLTGGAVGISGRFALLPGLAVQASGLVLDSPGLAASGSLGWRDERLDLALAGRSGRFGPFRLDGGGRIGALALGLDLAKPGFGLNSLAATVAQSGDRWQIRASAATAAGPAELLAGIALTPALQLDVTRLSLAGFDARGRLDQSADGPLLGTLAVAGPGLAGQARLFGTGGVQQADISLAGDNMRIAQETPISIDQLRLAASISLPASGPQISGMLALRGGERGNLVIETADGRIKLVDGKGDASLKLAGDSGAPFAIALTAAVAPGQIIVGGDGSYDGRRAQLAGPATISHDDDGWHLAALRLDSALGKAEISGDWGQRRRLQARLDQVSLALVGLAYPSINLAGKISGDIDVDQLPGAAPQGRASLRLYGLSRSAITSTSTPIDLGLNAALGRDGTAIKAVIMRAGKVEGRAQAQLGPAAAGADTLLNRLAAAPIAGQLRYAGPVQNLWGLLGLTALDFRGQAQVAADLAGTLGDPQIAGRIVARDIRVEAPLLGAVATGSSLDARFNASRLELIRFAGKSGQGNITGSGSIDLSLERGFPMDIRMVVNDAAILGRDDLSATGSGNIRVATDEYGGVVSGTLKLSRAEYRVGRTAVADVPVLTVTEKNVRLLGRRTAQYVAPTRWLYNLAVTADRQLLVTGMGIKSEWQAQVRLRGGATAPELFGRVQLVRGDYDFAGKRFQLTRGDIRFQGGYPPDPIVTVAAENASNGFTAQLSIEGTAQRPQIKFSSVPALPEDEVLSRVLFGARVTDLSAPEAIQLAGALTSLRGSGFNPIGAVSKGLGIDRLRILPADATMGRKTSVAAGQYLGRNVYVELATDAQGYTATSIEIGLTRSLSLLSSVATLGGTSAGVRWTKDY